MILPAIKVLPYQAAAEYVNLHPVSVGGCKAFSDEMFERAAAVNSDSQLYKQAGNGVTIPVVYAIGSRISAIEKELMLTQRAA